MENLYEILGVEIEADEKSIKKAYFLMVRKYPPEKAPEEFKKIREAYDVLSDKESKIEYDARLKYGQEIDELDAAGDTAMEQGLYDIGIKEFRKILIIEPKLLFAKNKLALALILNKELKEGISYLEELVELKPDNTVYMSNLAFGYLEQDEVDKAKNLYEKVLTIDYYRETSLSNLIDIYIKRKEYDSAINYLNSAIEERNSDEFREFIYYTEILRVLNFKDDIDSVPELIERIYKVIPESDEIKEDVSHSLYKIANNLYKGGGFSFAEVIIREVIKFYGSNNALAILNRECAELSSLSKQFEILMKDERIDKRLKSPIFYYLYRFTYSFKTYESEMKERISEINERIMENKKKSKKELEIIKKEYVELYNLKYDFYESLIKKIG